jgi:hypothetical protein
MSSLTEAEKKQAYRDRKRTNDGQMSDQCPDIVRTDVREMSTLDTDTDTDTEEDIEEDIKRESREKAPAPKPAREVKQKYGQFGNVLLTPNEYAKLCERFPDADGRIEHFSKKKAAKGYTYKSDYAALLSWADDKAERAQAQVLPQPKKTYTFAEVGEMMERGEIPA